MPSALLPPLALILASMTTVSGELEGLSKCCLSGHLHQGTPKGTVQKIQYLDQELDTYVTGTNKAHTVLFLTGLFPCALACCWV